MARTLVVLLQGNHIGTLTQEETGQVRLAYEDSWRRNPRATPLSLSMPLAARVHPHEVVEPFLWGLLPDNDKVLARWGRDNHVSPRNPFALLGHVGEECAGAVQFVRPERVEDAVQGGDVEWLDANEVAARIRLLREDPTAWQAGLHHGQFSLAGAQAKMALLRDGPRWGRPSGRIPTTHIIKPAIEGLDDHDLNEHLCLRAARLAGLRTATSEVVTFGDERAISVERYDRLRQERGIVRVHQEDLCQALGLPPTKKYQNDGGPTPVQIVELLRRVDLAAAPRSVEAFVEALAFNWLIGGTDAHAKNYSVLLDARQVRLAPLYDVASALPYEQLDRKAFKLPMSIGGEYRLDWIAGRHWIRLAQELQLDVDAVMARLRGLAERTPDHFADAGAEDVVRALDSPLPNRLTAAVARRSSECIRLLESVG